tara:strand:- start:2028 stop:2882 length:855 start_codon:yes stop_codon:yes gene_type:complete
MNLKIKQSKYQSFKWTGSKWLIANDIIPHLPTKGKTYFEPFVGGGAILVHAIPSFRKNIAGDIYGPLIDLWKQIKTNPEEIDLKYRKLWNELKDEVSDIVLDRDRGKGIPKIYYQSREEFNKTKDPFLLLFLTKTCLNGVIRFSSKGDFNNSFHHGRLGQKPDAFSKCIHNLSNHIKDTDFHNKEAMDLINSIEVGDVVFLDPPYFDSKNRYIENYKKESLEELINFINLKKGKWICTYDIRNEVNLSKSLYKTRLSSKKYQSRIRRISGQGIQDTQESIYLNF